MHSCAGRHGGPCSLLATVWLLDRGIPPGRCHPGCYSALGRRAAGVPPVGRRSVGVAFVLGLIGFIQLAVYGPRTVPEIRLFRLLFGGNVPRRLGCLRCALRVFVLLITVVGFLIHVYATSYIAHDAGGAPSFFGYFNLFVAAMLRWLLGNTT